MFFIAIPFAGILQYIRHNTAQVVTTDADAFNFNNFALLICQGIEFHLELFRQVNTPGQANTNGLFITTRFAITTVAWACFRLLWDDLGIRSTILGILPWSIFNKNVYTPIVTDALIQTQPHLSDTKDMDRVTEAIYTDPRTSAHIWYFGYGEMLFTAVFCTFTIHDFKPWTEQGFAQWNLGQILALVTLAPTVFELVVSFGGFSPFLSFFPLSQSLPCMQLLILLGGKEFSPYKRRKKYTPLVTVTETGHPPQHEQQGQNSRSSSPNPWQKSRSKKR